MRNYSATDEGINGTAHSCENAQTTVSLRNGQCDVCFVVVIIIIIACKKKSKSPKTKKR